MKIGPNVCIGDEVLVAMGSVVVKNFGSRCTIGGVPAKPIKENYIWHEHWGKN